MARVARVSVSLTTEELEWVRARAAESGQSLSSMMSEVLLRERQAWARAKVLAELGDGDILQVDIETVQTEQHRSQVVDNITSSHIDDLERLRDRFPGVKLLRV